LAEILVVRGDEHEGEPDLLLLWTTDQRRVTGKWATYYQPFNTF